MPGLTPKKKIEEYASYFGESFLESYFHMVDMGEFSESDSLRNWAEKKDEKTGAKDITDWKIGTIS